MANHTSFAIGARAGNGTRMNLNSLRKGPIKDHPKRILLYSGEGIGKTTFAARAPAPIFICAEDGTAEFDIARFPEPTTWVEVLEAVRTLRRDEHDFKTLVIDTLDWIEPLCWAHVCRAAGKSSIEDFGYGKGYVAALEQWRVLLSELDALRVERRVDIVLLAHAIVRTFKNPEGEDYDRYNLKIHEKAAGLVKEWADAVLFANYQTFTDKKANASKAKGISDGARYIFTERHAAYDAKNRFGLPDKLPLSWGEFARAAFDAEARRERVATLKDQMRRVLVTLGDEALTTKTEAWLAKVDDVGLLNEALNKLNAKTQQLTNEEKDQHQ